MARVLVFAAMCLLLEMNKGTAQHLKIDHKVAGEPAYFLDSVNVASVTGKIDTAGITSVTVYKGQKAIDLAGPEFGRDGLVFVESKDFSRKRFEKYLSGKSKKYAKLLNKTKDRSAIVYILNDKVQTGRYEGNLAAIDNNVFKSLEIIKPSKLRQKFGVESNIPGVLIRSDTPVKEL
jgi:hypothetical protein